MLDNELLFPVATLFFFAPITSLENSDYFQPNQIAQFDVAVHSRIYIAIKYDDLDDDSAIKIFMNFLEPLNRDGKVNDMKDIEKWLQRRVHRSKLDGRQIRNVVTSALSLALARGDRKLDKEYLSEIWDNVHDFKFEFIWQYENYKTQQKRSN
ncbi:hypothetical protein ZTR_08759 [Talaromyces verruculosus]|nr:hypothetical protein ZTR_08759 [Talaromyces verruculosus]